MLGDKVIIGKLLAIPCAILYAVLLAGARVLNTCSLGSVLAQLQSIHLQRIATAIFHLPSLEVFGFLILFFTGGIAADFLVFKLFICLLWIEEVASLRCC